jgi:hypothetical protein
MNRDTRHLRPFALAAVFIGAITMSTVSAPAKPAYPPDWNITKDVPRPLYDFIPGAWNDTNRYWPDQTRPGSNPSRPIEYGPVIYQFRPGGSHLRSLNAAIFGR